MFCRRMDLADLRDSVASVSVDLDPLWCYYAIHGLPGGDALPEGLRDVVLRRALPRFVDLFRRHGVRATLFVVGKDGEAEPGRRGLVEAARAGHELGNHSYSHPYDLSKRGAAEVSGELAACDRVLRAILKEAGRGSDGTGAGPDTSAPVGFRSPGYDLTPVQLQAAVDLGYRYDNSLFPCPPYYLAKVAVMAALRIAGRPSRAVLTDPRGLVGPALPYRPDPRRPSRRGSAPLIELPVAVTPWLRLPAIGTSLLVSEPLRRYLLHAMRRRPFFNLELHGLDLIDAAEDGIPDVLVQRQPDLRVPLAAKLRALDDTIAQIKETARFLPLREVAAAYAGSSTVPAPPTSSR